MKNFLIQYRLFWTIGLDVLLEVNHTFSLRTMTANLEIFKHGLKFKSDISARLKAF